MVVFCYVMDGKDSIPNYSFVFRQRIKGFWPRDTWEWLTSSSAGDSGILFLFSHYSMRRQEKFRTNLEEIGEKLSSENVTFLRYSEKK